MKLLKGMISINPALGSNCNSFSNDVSDDGMPDGSFKCETCQNEELKDRIVRVTPNSDRAKEISAERNRKTR